MKSLVRRRPIVESVDSSVTKMKTMWWMPSRGIRVNVDFASLGHKDEEMNIQKDLMELQNEMAPAPPEFVIGVSHLVGSKL